MSERIVVDPVTRIEGHLRIEAEVKDGRIMDAWSAGTMVRGLEIILKGRDPRDAWAFCERVCGVCTTVHALASVRSVEDALGVAVPRTRSSSATSCSAPSTCRTTWCTSTTCTPWTGSTSSAPSRPTRRRPPASPRASPLAQELTGILQRPAEAADELRRERPARHLRQRLLGPSGLQAAARGQPDRRGPLPRGPRVAEGDRQGSRDLRRQKPASQLPGGRRALLHQPGGGERHQRGAARHGRQLLKDASDSSSRSTCPDLMAIARTTWTGRGIGGGLENYLCYGDLPTNGFADIGSYKFQRGAILGRDLNEFARGRSPGPATASRSSSTTPGTRTQVERRACTPGRGRPRSTTRGPSPPMSTSTSTGSTPGLRRRAGRATPWRSAPFPACWSATPPATPRSRTP